MQRPRASLVVLVPQRRLPVFIFQRTPSVLSAQCCNQHDGCNPFFDVLRLSSSPWEGAAVTCFCTTGAGSWAFVDRDESMDRQGSWHACFIWSDERPTIMGNNSLLLKETCSCLLLPRCTCSFHVYCCHSVPVLFNAAMK